MRYIKWIIFASLFISSGAYVFTNSEYRDVQRQFVEHQSLEKKFERLKNSISFSQKNRPSNIEVEKVGKQMFQLERWLEIFKFMILGSGVVLFLLLIHQSNDNNYFKWLSTLLFLVLGITTPFLSIIVETGQINLPLLKKVSFPLYFQAKSVFDIICSLIATNRPYEILLGVLVGFFSLVAPIIKLCFLPLLPECQFKEQTKNFLWRFAWG